MTHRDTIEKLARRLNLRVDSLSDEAATHKIVGFAVHRDVRHETPEYLTAALRVLAAQPESRSDAAEIRRDDPRLDDERYDSRRAYERMVWDRENMWRGKLRADVGEASEPGQPINVRMDIDTLREATRKAREGAARESERLWQTRLRADRDAIFAAESAAISAGVL